MYMCMILKNFVIISYFSVAVILSKYRSGKLPKAFKVIPHLQNWEEVNSQCYLLVITCYSVSLCVLSLVCCGGL